MLWLRDLASSGNFVGVVANSTTTPADGVDAPVVELPVDFQLVGTARRFNVPITSAEQAALHVNSRVVLVGDAVDPLQATVVAFCGDNEAQVELI